MYCDWPKFTRCCFCMPLRRGVLVIAYIKLWFSAFMVGVYSYAVHEAFSSELLYNGVSLRLPAELCVFIYCVECLFSAILIYGAHKKLVKLVKIYYYFSLVTATTTLLMQIVDIATEKYFGFIFELIIFCFTGLCLQIYLLLLVWSLLKKLENNGPHDYENQLHQFMNHDGRIKVESNGIYNPSTVPLEV